MREGGKEGTRAKQLERLGITWRDAIERRVT